MVEKPKEPRKRAPAKAAPRKRTPPRPSKADREAAAAQMASVTSLVDRSKGKGPNGGRHGRVAKTTPAAIAAHDRRNRALMYRRIGLTWEQVAARVMEDLSLSSYAGRTAQADVRALLDTITVENVESARQEDLAILFSLYRKVYPAAMDGDLGAVREMRGLLRDRAQYLGLYAPVRHELQAAMEVRAELSLNEPGAIYDAAMEALADLLPPPEPPQMPALPGS